MVNITYVQFGNKLEMQEVYDKVKQFDLFGVSETHLLPKNGKHLTCIKIFIRIENMVNAVTTAAGGFQFILRTI